MINGTDDTVQNYNSNTVLDLADTLTNKFYVVKPVDSGLPSLRYTNIANNLIAQRAQLLSYMANHIGSQVTARYQAQIDEIDRALDTYGLVTYETVGSDTIKVIKRDLDVLVLDLPGLYSGVGSVVIRADGDTTDYSSQWAAPLSANADADLDVEAYVPLTIEVTDAVILSAQRSMTIGDSFYTLDQGGVYFNGIELEAAGSASSSIDIALDYDNGASVDWSHLGVSGVGAVTNLNITGQAYNQDGSLSASNAVGGINVSGTVRAGTVNIDSSAGLSINSDDILPHQSRSASVHQLCGAYLARLATALGGVTRPTPQLEIPWTPIDNRLKTIMSLRFRRWVISTSTLAL